MTTEEAMRIMHPDTTSEALKKIRYFGGFYGERAKIEAVDTACLVACATLAKQIPTKPNYEREQTSPFGEDDIPYCPHCHCLLSVDATYCEICGQRILWEGET